MLTIHITRALFIYSIFYTTLYGCLLFVFGFCKINNTISTCKEKINNNKIKFIRKKIDIEIAILPECVGMKKNIDFLCKFCW